MTKLDEHIQEIIDKSNAFAKQVLDGLSQAQQPVKDQDTQDIKAQHFTEPGYYLVEVLNRRREPLPYEKALYRLRKGIWSRWFDNTRNWHSLQKGSEPDWGGCKVTKFK